MGGDNLNTTLIKLQFKAVKIPSIRIIKQFSKIALKSLQSWKSYDK